MSSHAVPQPSAPDPVVVDPQHYAVEFEDAKVRVLRIRYGPGEKSRMHSHPELVGVMMTAARIRFTYPDGRSEDVAVTPGQVLHFPAVDHEPQHLGSEAFEVIAVELKG